MEVELIRHTGETREYQHKGVNVSRTRGKRPSK